MQFSQNTYNFKLENKKRAEMRNHWEYELVGEESRKKSTWLENNEEKYAFFLKIQMIEALIIAFILQ